MCSSYMCILHVYIKFKNVKDMSKLCSIMEKKSKNGNLGRMKTSYFILKRFLFLIKGKEKDN